MTSSASEPDRFVVEAFRREVEHVLGFAFDESRMDVLAEVLRKRLEATGCPTYAAYSEQLARSTEEVRSLAALVTVGETYFFRNDEQFRALAEVAVPDRIRRRGTEQLRILSAGCSTGEEPYTVGMVLRDKLARPDEATVLGVDVNAAALARAREARYSSWALRSTPEAARNRWFKPHGREFQLAEEIRSMVAFEEANLVNDDARVLGVGSWDVIFCRNVIMYFAPQVIARVVAALARALVPGGYLFLGHAETLRGLSNEFHLRQSHGTFYYQRRGADFPTSLLRDDAQNPQALRVLPGIVDPADSWMEVIGRASERIARLTSQHSQAATIAPPTPPPRRELALELIRQERFADALDLLHTVDEGDADGLLLRAVALTNGGALAQAEAACRALLAVDDLSAGGHYLAALCREQAGDPDGAVEHDRAAMYLDSTFAMPVIHFALLSKRAREHAASRQALQRALILLPREDAARLLLFGGGFSRDALTDLCRAELRALGGELDRY